MEFKPDDPNVVYGGSQIGGPSGIFKSTDNGQSWTQLTNGLPTSGVERCHIAVTPANPSVVYALFCGSDEGFYGIYKSVDEGASWTVQVILLMHLICWDGQLTVQTQVAKDGMI